MSKFTQTGTLPVGIEIDGVRHTEFELRPATIGDNIDVVEELGGEGSALRVSIAIYAHQLIKLGTLTKTQITFEIVRALAPSDFSALEEANEALKKKALEFGMPSPGGIPSASSAPVTA